MRYNTFINNVKAIEWGLNANQAALFDLLNQVQSWADEVITNYGVYYHISRNKVVKEIPLFYTKTDTVYRHFIVLQAKGLIEYRKQKNKDIIRLTNKGKSWNSERNPNSEIENQKLGNESESNSEMNPTYNTTITNNKTNTKKNPFIISKDTFDLFKHKDFKDWWLDFIEVKKKRKGAMSNRVMTLQYEKLFKLANGNKDKALEILINSVNGGWSDFYPLKEDKKNNFNNNQNDAPGNTVLA